MARYTDAVCRLCRREGVKLYLKGEKCYSDKCPVVKRQTPPGQHGASRRKMSEYGIQLREKQKARRFYGVLENQFERYFDLAARKKGVTGEILLQTLERRLDNIVYRMGFAASRSEARQVVKHSHIEVNGRKVNIPSYLVREGDVIALREGSRDHKRVKELVVAGTRTIPAWLTVEAEALRGTVLRMPTREEIDAPVQEHLIVELYSR
ncbi:MAG TPA: 30S ribosomal protein S4 [Symbiobacteriaceae bacterium]|nr:30S ribosomal protein S4 [Symbiobacteriaceae bacterium]